MDDISAMLSSVLEDPAAMERLRSVASELLGDQQPAEATAKQDADPKKTNLGGGFPINGDMMSMIAKFAPMLSVISEEDDSTKLLHALRPFLEDEKRQKLDEATKMMKILRVLPVLKEKKIL